MKNKKYRPFKLWIILIAAVLLGIIATVAFNGWLKILVLVCTSALFLVLILCLTYWFEVKEDRIIIRHGISSYDKQYRSNFKTRTILFENIACIDLRNSGRDVVIGLKDGKAILFTISGYSHRNEIVKLVYEIKKQI